MGTAPPASMSMGFWRSSGALQPVRATAAPSPEAMIIGFANGWISSFFQEILAPPASPRTVR